MVNSILNPKINYPENKKLRLEDKDYDASLYEIEVLGEDIMIALGQGNYDFIDDNIINYPIYLVKNDKVSKQIGIYEILESELPNLIDDDGDLELEKVNDPLIYQFVDKNMIEKASITEKKVLSADEEPSADDEKPSTDDEKPSSDDEKPSADDEKPSTDDEKPLEEGTKEIFDKEREEYREEKSDIWIKKFLKSNEYNILDSKGSGDCIFEIIRDSLQSIDKDVSVLELKDKLVSKMNDKIFENYKSNYDNIIQDIQENESKMKLLSKQNNELRDRLKNSKNREEQKEIVKKAKQVAEEFTLKKQEKSLSKELIQSYRYMKKANNLEEFKKIIKTCEFWTDPWFLSALEKALNLKLIVFSSEAWKQGDNANVLLCGSSDYYNLENEDKFEPKQFILVDYTGSNYKLITYKFHRIFTFFELPYYIKLLVSSKCLERNSGIYNNLSDFKLFNKELGIDEPIDLEVETVEESKSNNLYDNKTIFQFYKKSNNKPLPGKGNGEKIDLSKIKDFSSLASIPEWRRKLDDSYESEFTLDGHKWKTVDHFIEANKFKNTNKEFYLLFSLDSDSEISKNIEMAQAAASKSGKFKGNLLRNKEIKIDEDYYKGLNEKAQMDAQMAKFTQIPEMKKILLATKDAKLLHFKKASEPEIMNSLMIIRNNLK